MNLDFLRPSNREKISLYFHDLSPFTVTGTSGDRGRTFTCFSDCKVRGNTECVVNCLWPYSKIYVGNEKIIVTAEGLIDLELAMNYHY